MRMAKEMRMRQRIDNWVEDRCDWWEANWDVITPWFMVVIGAGILSVTFIV